MLVPVLLTISDWCQCKAHGKGLRASPEGVPSLTRENPTWADIQTLIITPVMGRAGQPHARLVTSSACRLRSHFQCHPQSGTPGYQAPTEGRAWQ